MPTAGSPWFDVPLSVGQKPVTRMPTRFLHDPERRRAALRVVGLLVGVAVLIAAIRFAMAETEGFASAIAALRDPPPAAVALVLASVLVGMALSGTLFHILMRRFGSVPFGEMQALIAASTLANYLPLKPGLLGRVAYHRVRHGIRPADTLRGLVEAIVLSGVVASMFLLALALFRHLGVDAEIDTAWSLVAPAVFALGAVRPGLRTIVQALLVRQAELALWTLRYWAVFRLVGAPIGLETAIVLGSVSVIATLVPFISNGLGIREWLIGLLAPFVSDQPVTSAQAIVAELVHRAAEIAVVGPVGLVATAWLVRHARRFPASGAESADRAPRA